MKILKFGGASLAGGEKILHVAQIIKRYVEKERIVVVVSAMSGVTDRLISIFQNCQKEKFNDTLGDIKFLYESHVAALDDLGFGRQKYLLVEKSFKNLFGQLLVYLTLRKEFSLGDYDYVVSFGERLSCLLVSKVLQGLGVKAKAVDSFHLIITTDEFKNAKVLLKETEEQVKMVMPSLIHQRIIPIMTGFYGSTRDGKVALLGRGGSDYSATALAYALNASEVILWKEVDGVFDNDPMQENDAKFFPELSYTKALILAKNGAKVLHREAIKPAMEKEIVVWVKNVFKPDFIGTKIWKEG